MSTPQYDLMRASITDDDCVRVFDFLYPNCIGFDNRCSIEDIAYHLYHSRSDGSVRKARDVVEILRTEFGIAVCSSSGKAGRWLAANESEKESCLADFRSRRASIDAVIQALQRAKVPPPREATRLVEQRRLF